MLMIMEVVVVSNLTFMFIDVDISICKLYCWTLSTEIEGLSLYI